MLISIRRLLGRYRRSVQNLAVSSSNKLNIAFDKRVARFRKADVAVFHEFSPPPVGGGHQFLRALCSEFDRRGLRVENNTISAATRACIFNSFNFDFYRLRRLHREGCRMVHRVDGPIGVYRGSDDGTDKRIWEINQELADATIFQSSYSLRKHVDLGLKFKSPFVIMNTTDERIFHSLGRVAFERNRKVRLISTSWSDNPNKGAAIYKWIEDHLDWDRYEYTFVGRSQIRFERIRVVPPVPSDQVADALRQHDIIISASRHEACSNALLEALSCGLPALYLDSGSNSEVVGNAGLGFSLQEEIPYLLDLLVIEYEYRQSVISVPALAEVADRYLRVMGIAGKSHD